MKNDPQEIASMIDLCEHVNDPRGGNYTEICRQWDRESAAPEKRERLSPVWATYAVAALILVSIVMAIGRAA